MNTYMLLTGLDAGWRALPQVVSQLTSAPWVMLGAVAIPVKFLFWLWQECKRASTTT